MRISMVTPLSYMKTENISQTNNQTPELMKRIFLFAILFIAFSSYAAAPFGDSRLFNDDWQFVLCSPSDTTRIPVKAHWQSVTLPHDWSVRGTYSPDLYSATGYLPGGVGWYRKTLELPAEQAGQRVYLYFEGIYNRSRIYINDSLICARPNGYISFACDITPYVHFGASNQIAICVDHSRVADSRWYTGSGIYRNVWLGFSGNLHFDLWGVYAWPQEANEQKGVLAVEIGVKNESKTPVRAHVICELIDPQNEETLAERRLPIKALASGVTPLQTTLEIKHPALWSLEHPNLYKVRTTLYLNDKAVDRNEFSTGFRTLTFDPNRGFALNGQWIKVKGVCLHHDAGVLGAAVYADVWRRRLETLKSLGCNAIRTSHNPQAPVLYELCDELGLLVLNEAYDEWEYPKRKWLKGWNVGTPGYDSSCDIFAKYAEQDLADMVKRDRNHVSIFAWSIGNEIDYPNDPYSHPVLDGRGANGFTQPIYGGYKPDAPNANRLGDIAKRLVSVVKRYDCSRPVTAGLAGVAMSNCTEYPSALDITGYNYTENRYDSDHETYPDRVIFGSENRHDIEAWRAVVKRPHIFGQFIWTGIDYLGESGPWPSRGFYSGLLDFGGFVKPRGHFRASLWNENPVIYLGSYPIGSQRNDDVWSQHSATTDQPSMDAWPIWNYNEDEVIRVVCYTNAASVDLLLNGKILQTRKQNNTSSGIIHWDIPYTPGELTAIGYNATGDEVSRCSLQTTGRPFALEAEIIGRSPELVQLLVKVMDEHGKQVMLADNEVQCDLSGGKLLGIESSNNQDMSDYTDNHHRVFHGQMVVYVQPIPNKKLACRFSSPLLRSTIITIE